MNKNSPPQTALTKLNEEARAEYWAGLALRYCKGLGARGVCRLLQHFGSAYQAVYNVPRWAEANVYPKKGLQLSANEWREKARPEWEDSRDLDGDILLWTDPRYPDLLRRLPDAPALLYARGDLSLLCNACVAIVGSRHCTAQNLRLAEEISGQLSASGITVVSGLARGIDAAAHKGALANEGSSIAVLGAGLDVVYPPQNERLYDDLSQRGLILSEFPPGTRPDGRHFPIRNRIISGLALGVLVVEAAKLSGSLITARLALEQNREVYAVPPPNFDSVPLDNEKNEFEDGCAQLLSQGAKPVRQVLDIVEDLFPQLSEIVKKKLPKPSPPEVRPAENLLHPRIPALPIPMPDFPIMETATPAVKKKAQARQAAKLKIPACHPRRPPKDLPKYPDDSPQAAIIELLSTGPLLADEILRQANAIADAGQLNALLLTLEVEGAITRLPGLRYSLP